LGLLRLLAAKLAAHGSGVGKHTAALHFSAHHFGEGLLVQLRSLLVRVDLGLLDALKSGFAAGDASDALLESGIFF